MLNEEYSERILRFSKMVMDVGILCNRCKGWAEAEAGPEGKTSPNRQREKVFQEPAFQEQVWVPPRREDKDGNAYGISKAHD